MKRLFLFLVLPVLLVSADDGLVDVFSANATAGGNTYFCIKIPTLLEHPPTGSLIALGEGRVGSCADVAWTDLLIRRSVDGGRFAVCAAHLCQLFSSWQEIPHALPVSFQS